MSKVICDVCGTTYPETAAQCPICGSAKASAGQTAAGGEEAASSGGYTSVKGGRFSKQNVKKRNKRASATTAQRRSSSASSSRTPVKKAEPNNTGLVIVVVLLLLAIVTVLIYIVTTYFGSANHPDDPKDTTGSTAQTTQGTENTQPPRIACTGLLPSNTVIEFTEAGQSWKLQVELTPVDTTDAVSFRSEDEAVATVDEDGTVTAVGGGSTQIIISCGDVSTSCLINCSFGQQNTEPPTGVFEFEFNTIYVDAVTGYYDCTLSAYGTTWKAYKPSLTVPVDEITWVSDDPSIATIENGVVKAMAPGVTRVHASYNGVTYTCVIRCVFSAESVGGECVLSHTDVTITVGQSFTLKLKDTTGTVNVTWTADGEGVSIDGNTISGVSKGTYKVSCSYDGVTYTCVVRVK